MRESVAKICSACGARFTCGPQGEEEKCWCAALPSVSPREGSDCFCSQCLHGKIAAYGANDAATQSDTGPPLQLGEDYTIEGSAIVFTARYLLRRGKCCGSGCRHCPYEKIGTGRSR